MDTVQSPAGGLAVVVAVNDDTVLARNLAASPLLAEGRAVLHVERGASCAGAAYNAGLDATDAELVVFAHQDVYLPPGWDRALRAAVATLEAHDPNWAVLGVFGTTDAGDRVGLAWSSGLGRCVGRALETPVTVQSVDELVIVLRRSAGLRFDETLPHFHLYGTDIVMMARAAGLGAYVATLPVVHNSRFVASLGGGFARAFFHMRRKWWNALPLRTPVVWIERIPWRYVRLRAAYWRSQSKRAARAADATTDPRLIAATCGWLDQPVVTAGNARA